MDNQRMQAYVELIEQLLGCPQGEDAMLLQTNGDLVDAGLLSMMGQYADWLESQGNRKAGRLRQFSAQLSQVLGLEEDSQSSQAQEDAAAFAVKIVQLIVQTRSDRAQVYEFFRANVGQLDEALLRALPDLFTMLIQQIEPAMIAEVFVEFGNLINQFPLGYRRLNLELSIVAYEQVLQVYTRDVSPEQWAMTQNNLAIAYFYRIHGERAENLERAIIAFEQALRVYTRDAFLEQWAMTQNNLAAAYNNRICGERAENLERAINAYEQALQVRTRDDSPEQWAMTQNNLAAAYLYRICGERAGNLERAFAAAQRALQVYTRDAFPEQWATTQNNLANAYNLRIRGERAENLERAITAYEQAFQVYTRDAFPADWAMTQNNLASVYFYRIRGERAENLERMIGASQRALQVYTRDAFPEQWAMTQNNLAGAYNNRIRGERAENLERAITASQRALQVYTRDAFPERWATTQNNLAIAYFHRIRGERAENLERTITAYEQALQVYTRDAFPEQWAMTQNNLAIAYSDRIRGERAENLERAISASEQALQVYTHDAFPERWATTQNNLANAYNFRICGERAENLERAISAYEQAFQVYTRDAFPEQWAMTQNNLAATYNNRIRGERAENLERAITAYKQALQVRTRDAFPKDCRQTAQKLGNLHFQAKSWAAAVDAYQIATAAAETLYQSSISYNGKGDELKATGDIPRCLAYAQAQLGNRQAAILTLEQSRARSLSENLNRDRADFTQLQTLAPTLYTDYQEITQQLRNLERGDLDHMVSTDRDRVPDELINTTTRLRQALNQIIAQIRQVPGYEDFLTPTKWADIVIALRRDHSLVYLVTTPNGGVFLIVTVYAINVLWLDTLTNEFLKKLLVGSDNIEALDGGWFVDYLKAAINRQSWLDTISTATRQLWDVLIGPLVVHLQAQNISRITLIPTGLLSLLPLHAAWTPDETKPTGRRYALDDICITYAPNAQALTAAQAISDQVQANSILAIDNPRNDLPNSDREVQVAVSTFPRTTVLRHDQATVNQVRSQLPNATIAHFSCHGTANLTEPLNSGLLMSDGLLTLKDIFALNLADTAKGNYGIRLAILSACETGMIGIENADEAISLPTGLLQAGVAAVIASLWSVSDLSTMLLLTRFYHLWRKDGLEPGQALRQAQIWLRDSTAGEIAAYGGFFTPTPDERPYAHPFHWAAFSYTGI